jgi:hypothetical protein
VQTLALDPKTATLHTVVDVGGGARYRDGHLLFARGEVLLGAPFDPGRLAMTSAPVALERGLRCAYRHLPGDFDIGPTGDLYLVPGGELASTRRLGIVGPDGRVTPLGARMASFGQWPSASASGREFVAISTNAEGIDEIWYGTVDRPGLRRVVAWPDADAVAALLSPDGRTVAYGRFGRDDLDGVYLADVRSTDGGRRILRPESTAVRYRPDGWSPDGRRLLLSRLVRGGTSDLWLAELDTARDTLVGIRRLMNAHVDFAYDISPDGRWLAWDSNASGRYEVYAAEVSSDGTLGDPIPITDDGGTVPEWTSDGRRLVVRDESRLRVRIVEVGMPPGPGPHRSRPWFDGAENGVRDFSVLPGDRAIALLRGENERDQIETAHVIVGWTRTLRKRLAAGP